VSEFTTEHASGTAPHPVGWQQILNPKLSRRSFLAGTAALPIATETAFADAVVSMDLELDLSSDGGTLTVREFPHPAPGQKPDEGLQRIWRAIAAAFGPQAWFDLTIDADDDNLKHLRIRDARYGATDSIDLEFFFLPVLSPDKTRVDHWAMELTTDLWRNAKKPGSSWTSGRRAFKDFAANGGSLLALANAANATVRLGQMFDRRIATDDKTGEALTLAFHNDCLWSLSRKQGVAATSFDGVAKAGTFTLGWHQIENQTPFMFGYAKKNEQRDDRVSVSSPFRVGGKPGIRVSVHDFATSALEWEARQVASPLVPKATQTFVKLTFGTAQVTIAGGADPAATPIAAAGLFIAECRLPLKDQRVRRTLWGTVAQADAPSELRTLVGRLGVNAPALSAPPSAPGASSTTNPTQDMDALIASGDRTGAQEATIWAVLDQTEVNEPYAVRRAAVDLSLLSSDLALPDVSHSALTFDSADFRLSYEDGEPMKELSAGESPRPPASSYLWIGPLDAGKEIAHFDLSRATLAVARDVDLVKLRFRFLDLTLVLTPEPIIRSRHAECRVIDLGNGHFRDDRPVLVAEFGPQHVFEEAIFRQNIPLPDVAEAVDVKIGDDEYKNQDRDAIVKQIAVFAGDPGKLVSYRQAIQTARAAKDPHPPAFINFCKAFNAAANAANLPSDQQTYVGPFALDPDAMAIARQVERSMATDAVTASINAMFDRITQFIKDDKNSKTTHLLAPMTPTGAGSPGPDDYYLANALRNETVLEQQEPVYGVFRDYYRSEMIGQYYAKSQAWAPVTLDSLDIEFFADGDRSSWQPLTTGAPPRAPAKDPRDDREAALRKTFIQQIVGDDPAAFSDLSDARLAQPSRLAFHINCAPAPNATAEEAGLNYSAEASPGAPNSGGFNYPALPFTFADLSNWSRHEPAVTLRARKLFSGNASGIVPPIGARAANLSDDDVLAYQGITRGGVAAEQRLSEIRAALAKKPTPYETAIEIPARLTLSTAQDAIWFDKRKLPWRVVYEHAGTVPVVAPEETTGGETVMEPGEPVRRSHQPLWVARLALDGLEPNLRIVDSPDLRPNALTWLKPNDVRQIGQGAPPRGPFAPWFIGPEQMDATTLTAGGLNATLPAGAQIAKPLPNGDPRPVQGNIVMTVTGAAAGNNGVVRLAVNSTVGVAAGDTVVGANIGGTTEANGTFVTSVIDATHIDLQGTKFVHAWTSGGTLTIEPASEAELCNPPLLDRIWRLLRLLCGRQVDRDALDGLRLFRAALDAYDRHELVLLSSAYGLPVIGKRKAREGDPSRSEAAGGLVANSGQIEPGDNFSVLDADEAQAIQRPQQLRVRELWLSALGGSFIHDTQFLPSAGANDLLGGKVFDGFSIERWRAEIVLGRDIVGEVVYKGYLFPLGHRASLVKLTERLFLRSETLGVKAVLVQRIFVRVGRKTQAYPAVGHPFDGRLWCARDVTMLTVQTPDLQDPYEKPKKPADNPENLMGGRIDLQGAPGLAFWPRVNETPEGLVNFDFTIDGAETSMPLIFVDNIAATNGASLQALVEIYRRWEPWLPRRSAALRDQNIRYAQETKTGDCTLKTQNIVVSVHGGLRDSQGAWTGHLTAYDTTAILEGAEQPPFYPSVETATVRLENVERFSGGAPRPVNVQYDGRYVRFGFSRKSADSGKPTNPLEIFLNLRKCIAMSMDKNGDRGGAVGRPDSNIVAIGRGNGPIGASGAIIYEISGPSSSTDPMGTAQPGAPIPICDGAKLIDEPLPEAAFQKLLSLADFFDPQNPYLNRVKGMPGCGPAGTASFPTTGVPAAGPPAGGGPAPDTGAVDAIRKVLSTFFSDSARILGVVRYAELLQFLGFDTSSLLGATPVLRETLLFGSDAAAGEDPQILVQDIHSQVLAPLSDAVQKLQTQWQSVSESLKKELPKQVISLAQVFPEIDSGLHDLEDKIATAQADNDPIGLFLDLAAVYESARAFAAALDRIASNPVARLQTAAIGAVQDLLAQFQQPTAFLDATMAQIGTNLDSIFNTGAIGSWLKDLVKQDANGALNDTLTFTLVSPDLVALAKQTASGIGTSFDAINTQLTTDLSIDVSVFATAIIDDVVAGKNLDDTFNNFQIVVKSQVDKAIQKAKVSLEAQLASAQPQAVFIIEAELDTFANSIMDDPRYAPALQDIYSAVTFIFNLITTARRLRTDITAGSIDKSLVDLAALADMIVGVGDGQPFIQIDQSLGDGFKKLKSQLATSDLMPPTTGADFTTFTAEIAACKTYHDWSAAQKQNNFPPLTATPAAFEPMKTLDAFLAAAKVAQTAVNSVTAVVQANQTEITTKASAIGLDVTSVLKLIHDAGMLMSGPDLTDLGLVGDVSTLYCAFVTGLARMGAAVALIPNTDWSNVDKELVAKLTGYEQACAQSAKEIGNALASAINRLAKFINDNKAIIADATLLAGAIDTIANIPGLSIGAQLSQLSNNWKTQEKNVVTTLTTTINVLIQFLKDGGAFASSVTTLLGGALSSLDALLAQIGVSLDPEETNLKSALKSLSDVFGTFANYATITTAPSTIAGLLATPIVTAGATPTVQSLFTNTAAQTYQQISVALHNAEAGVFAEWRALQARVKGLPQYLQRAVVVVAQTPLQTFSSAYQKLLTFRNDAAAEINSPLLSLQARRSLFVAPVYKTPPGVDVNDPTDDDAVFQALEASDRLAEEVDVLKNISAYTPPAAGQPDVAISNFIRFLDSWTTTQAAPLQIGAKVQGLAAQVLKGNILALIDVAAFRDTILDAIAQLVPTKAVFSYDFGSTVTEPPDDDAIFQAQLNARFVLSTKVEVDLLNGGDAVFTAAGSIGPFAIKLVGSVVDALTLRFGGASFAASNGAAPRFDVSYNSYEVGPALDFVQQLQEYLTPSDGAGFHIGPLDWTLGIEAGYGVNLGSIGIGEVSFFNIIFDVSADLPFTSEQALFKTSLGTRLSPFTISILPYAGSGYFSLFAAADGIRGFEASFLFGGGGSLSFGPLEAQVQVQVGTFIRVLNVNGVNSTEIAGTFLAAGSMTIWIFNFAASLYVSLGEDNGNMYGEATFTFSFSAGFIDYSYSVTVSHSEPQLGSSGGANSSELEPGPQPLTRYAALIDRNVSSDALEPLIVAAADVYSASKPPAPKPQNADVVSNAICQSENWKTYASYFDFDLVQ
jgi:hypothetical protein